MPYQTPITIKRALDQVHAREFVLPAIQREFVWKPAQVCQLFDSLLRKYPIGAFLFWRVDAEHSHEFVFYEVMDTYHERLHRHCDRLNLPQPRPLTAILDGQQRLTALNIGLNGSHAEKLPRKWTTSADAYPVKELYLDLCHQAPDDELGMHYRFDFLPPQRAAEEQGEETHWYRVRDVLGIAEAGGPVFEYVLDAGIKTELHKQALRTLERLRFAVHDELVISYHEEEEQEIDRVLNIFIRVNSAGTPLSYSDLLLSIAVAQWTERDAREEIYQLVDSLNDLGQGFSISKDLVLKAGLVVTDATDTRFKVANFNNTNMSSLESAWDDISKAMRLTVQLITGFGFSGRTLTADSALIPVADYLHFRSLDDSYLTSGQNAADRGRVRDWLVRSLLKSGVWGSGLDTLLVAIRREIREHGATEFPSEALDAAMAKAGHSLRFEIEEVEDLASTQYGKGRVFALLALLYPGIDVKNEFHIDHVFPQAHFTQARLEKAGIPAENIPCFLDHYERLPNLQLLEGPVNSAKLETLPLAWAEERYPDEQARGLYLAGHDLDGLPADLGDFGEFFDQRRDRMIQKLSKLLGAEEQRAAVPAEPVAP